MRIGIITFHRAYNCGAMLQAWALKTVLERMGHAVHFPHGAYNEAGRVPPVSPLRYRARKGTLARRMASLAWKLVLAGLGKKVGVTAGKRYDAFRRENLPELECEVADFARHFDAVVLGSDQVLNPTLRDWVPYFLCREIPAGVRKIAYAASVGEEPRPRENETLAMDALASFAAVSVREAFGGFRVLPDPTLLLDGADYDAIAKPFEHRREYLYVYSCEASRFEIETAREIARRLGLDLLITPTHGTYERKKEKDVSNKISPSLMVSYIKGAKCVMAGSFHGAALSLLHGKPFVNIIPDHRSTKRVSTMLEAAGEKDRIVNPDHGIDDMIARLVRPIGPDCARRLARPRREAIAWLEAALQG